MKSLNNGSTQKKSFAVAKIGINLFTQKILGRNCGKNCGKWGILGDWGCFLGKIWLFVVAVKMFF